MPALPKCQSSAADTLNWAQLSHLVCGQSQSHSLGRGASAFIHGWVLSLQVTQEPAVPTGQQGCSSGLGAPTLPAVPRPLTQPLAKRRQGRDAVVGYSNSRLHQACSGKQEPVKQEGVPRSTSHPKHAAAAMEVLILLQKSRQVGRQTGTQR